MLVPFCTLREAQGSPPQGLLGRFPGTGCYRVQVPRYPARSVHWLWIREKSR